MYPRARFPYNTTMPRTFSVTVDENGIADLNGEVADDLESLRQRVVQAIKHTLGEWFLNTSTGIRRELLQGHQTTLDIAAATITAAIRNEGGSEITSISTPVVQLDHDTRKMTYKAEISTIYQDSFSLNETVN